MISIKGIFPPLPTSFKKNEELYPEKIRENIESLMNYGLSGIVVLGSNGELVMLSEKEKERVYGIARDAIPEGKLMIAGSGGESTRETIRLTKMAAIHGADAALVLNPNYYQGLMTPKILLDHYNEVADASEIPVIVYNIPANSGIDMNAETILSMAEHPNIIGLKDSGGNIVKMGEVIRQTGDDFFVLAGSGGFLLPALAIGADGGILALANVLPEKCLEIMSNFLEGNLDKAREIQQSMIPLNTAITKQWGIPALKAAMDHLGLYGGPARKPLTVLEPSSKEKLIKLLKSTA